MPQPPQCSSTCRQCGFFENGSSPGPADVADRNDEGPPQKDSQAASLAALRATVENMAWRQDRLIHVVEQHLHYMVGAHPYDVELGKQAASQPRQLPQLEIALPTHGQASLASQDAAPPKRAASSNSVGTRSEDDILNLKNQGSTQSQSSTRSASIVKKSDIFLKKTFHYAEDLPAPIEADHGFCNCDVVTVKWAKQIVGTRTFELVSGSIIFVNMITLFVQLQWQSCDAALALGFSEDDCGWSDVGSAFDITEYLFNAWYVGELMLRMYAFRRDFVKDSINLFDTAVVCMAVFQHASVHVQVPGIAPLRTLRLLRSLRIVRVIRLLLVFKELHILLKTLAVSFFSLHWSMCLLGVLIWAAGILVMQLLESFLRDQAQDFEARQYLYMTFGTPFRAVYSMFVATFSTAWVPMAQKTIEYVSPFFACFWILYIVSVHFAVVRVIAALFLRQTLDVASHDAERRAMEVSKNKEKFARTLHEIFARADESGDGLISKEEFAVMIKDPNVMKLFQTLHLDEDEVCALFEVLSSDDGCADYEEFLRGAMKMKGSARTFDVVQILHELGVVSSHLHDIDTRLSVVQHAAAQPILTEKWATAEQVAVTAVG